MKTILVQDAETKLFLDPLDGWTAERANARNFPNSFNAIVHCVRMEITNVQLCVHEDSPRMREIVVTIGDEHLRIANDFTQRYRNER